MLCRCCGASGSLRPVAKRCGDWIGRTIALRKVSGPESSAISLEHEPQQKRLKRLSGRMLHRRMRLQVSDFMVRIRALGRGTRVLVLLVRSRTAPQSELRATDLVVVASVRGRLGERFHRKEPELDCGRLPLIGGRRPIRSSAKACRDLLIGTPSRIKVLNFGTVAGSGDIVPMPMTRVTAHRREPAPGDGPATCCCFCKDGRNVQDRCTAACPDGQGMTRSQFSFPKARCASRRKLFREDSLGAGRPIAEWTLAIWRLSA